jgi:hypothetical protein
MLGKVEVILYQDGLVVDPEYRWVHQIFKLGIESVLRLWVPVAVEGYDGETRSSCIGNRTDTPLAYALAVANVEDRITHRVSRVPSRKWFVGW